MIKVLSRYFKILEGKELPKFKQANLKEKIRLSRELLKSCELCEHRCRVNRKTSTGFCGAKDYMEVSSWFPHYGEEDFLVPSFTIFFTGCNFRCVFCQNYTISNRMKPGMQISPEKLATVIDEYSWCKNVNFVGGEPTPYLPFILETLSHVNSNVPVVWNSNFYMSTISMHLLKNIVDIYLPDWKYGNNKCAERLSGIKNYWEIISRNVSIAFKDSTVVIRHLILPEHVDCCSKPILEHISENYGNKVIVNLMPQYRPEYLAHKFPDINKRPRKEEIKAVWAYAEKLGINWIH